MNRICIANVLVAVALGSCTTAGQGPEKQRKGFLAVLNEGQAVTVKEVAGRYEITLMDNMPALLGHKVIEVGSDYVVVEDIAGVTQTRISVYSIKAIVRLNLPRK